jgi:hypothetical protein
MRIQISILALFLTTTVTAGPAVSTYGEARASWEKSKDSKEYQTYAEEFIQFNNHFHLDEKTAVMRSQVGRCNLCLSSLIETRSPMP